MTGVGPLLTIALTAALVQAPSVDDVVRRFVPFDLGLDSNRTVETCQAVLETDRSGQPTVVAAVYVSRKARLRILQREEEGRLLPIAEDGFDGGQACEAQAIDFDGDQRPEIFVTVSIGMRAHHWEGRIYRWNQPSSSSAPAQRLVLADAGLHDPQLIDVLHDGTMQIFTNIVDYDELVDGPRTGYVFSGVDGSPDALAGFRETWTVCYGDCEPEVARLREVEGAGVYVLRLVNGERGGAHRARLSSVKVNGREKLAAKSRGTNAEFIDVPVGELKPGATVSIQAKPIGAKARLVAVLMRR